MSSYFTHLGLDDMPKMYLLYVSFYGKSICDSVVAFWVECLLPVYSSYGTISDDRNHFGG